QHHCRSPAVAFESHFPAEGSGQRKKEMNMPLSPNLVRDGKLDRQAVEAGLRRCLDTVLRAGQFDLRYAVEWQEATAADGLDSPEVIVNFDGGARELLLEHGGELL